MNTSSHIRLIVTAFSAGAMLGAYAAYAAITWHRYGRIAPAGGDERDDLLDRFMPTYDIVERHRIGVAAAAGVTLAAAREQDLFESPLVRGIFRAREIVLGTVPDRRPRPRGLIATVQALGWGILAEAPGRELVVGAVTRPWEPNVTFRALPPEEFAAFSQPGFVKIAWTLRADPGDGETSIFRTETRAIATDATARTRFRRYWALTSCGIVLIRRLLLRPLKREAERRALKASVARDVPRAGTSGDWPRGWWPRPSTTGTEPSCAERRLGHSHPANAKDAASDSAGDASGRT